MGSARIDDIFIWPDGRWCYRCERVLYGALDDDYVVVASGSVEWHRLKNFRTLDNALVGMSDAMRKVRSSIERIEEWKTSEAQTQAGPPPKKDGAGE